MKLSSVKAVFLEHSKTNDHNKIVLADFVITPPNRKTTGLLEDLQIVV